MNYWLSVSLIVISNIFYLLMFTENRRNKKHSPWFIAVLGGSVFALQLLNQKVSMEFDFSLYGYLLIGYTIFFVFLLILLEGHWKQAFYYIILFFQIIDCCQILISYASMKLFAVDHLFAKQSLLLCLLLHVILIGLKGGFLYAAKFAMERNRIKKISLSQVLLMILPIIPYLYIRDITFWLPVQNENINLDIPIMLILLSTCSLVIILGNESILSYHIRENEVAIMSKIIEFQHESYRIKKEAIDTINKRHHDLRNYILYMKRIPADQSIEALNNLEKEITPYESIIHSGNDILDILLSEKYQSCRTKNIEWDMTVDGLALKNYDFLNICTIVGNMLDNAIESVDQITNVSQRLITLRILRKKGFSIIKITNPYFHQLIFENGTYLTTKPSRNQFGYGLSNVKSLVEAMNGHISISADDHVFTVTVCLPVTDLSN